MVEVGHISSSKYFIPAAASAINWAASPSRMPGDGVMPETTHSGFQRLRRRIVFTDVGHLGDALDEVLHLGNIGPA
jgi:hypothetical protein